MRLPKCTSTIRFPCRHTLGKLANVKEIASNLCVIAVNIAAGIAFRFAVMVGHNDALTVRDAEQLLIVAVNKANIPVGFFDVLVQPLLHIAEAVEVIVPSDGDTAKQKRILFGVGWKAEHCGVPFAGRYCACTGMITLSAAVRALSVIIPRDGIQSIST